MIFDLILFTFIAVIVPTLVYMLLPMLIEKLTTKKPVGRKLLILAGLIFFISRFLPSPLIMGQDTSFSTHFVGGGIFCGVVWLYVRKQLSWKFSPLLDLVCIYLLVSSLGVANELFELALSLSGRVRLSSNDTWWDLLANTLGALLFWVGLWLNSLRKA